MSGEQATRAKVPRPGLKTGWSGWWEPPPGTGLYAPIPYVAPIVEDALSLTEQRVLRVLTNVKMGAKRQSAAEGTDRGGYLCDPGGYGRIAKNAGVCRKTAYNTIKSLIAKGVLRIFELKERGKQRVKTLYFAPHYGDVLITWRADEAIFKTGRGSVVVRGRAKRIMSAQDAIDWKVDPMTAPRRGCGRARQPDEAEETQEALPYEEEAKAAAAAEPESQPETLTRAVPPPTPAPPGTDERIAAVLGAMQLHTRANLKDALDAQAAAERSVPGVNIGLIVACIASIAREYKPNKQFPMPRPKWFIDRMPAFVHHADKERRRRFVAVRPENFHPEDRTSLQNFLEEAIEIRDSGRAAPDELEYCNYWIERLTRTSAAG